MFYRLIGRLFWFFVVLPFITNFLKTVAIFTVDKILVTNGLEPMKPMTRRPPRPPYNKTPPRS